MARLLLIEVIILLSAVSSGADTPLFDFEQPVFIERGYRVKDHALVHDGARFHLFHIRGALDADSDPSFGHAVSEDLRRWEHLTPVLPVPAGTAATRSIWAPQVLPAGRLPAAWRPAGAVWAMFFTGVNDAGSQSICLAWSSDLTDWTPEPQAVYQPGTWADWSAAAWADCRDPFLFAAGDSLFLLVTARHADGRAALALAACDSQEAGPPRFSDRGPLILSTDGGALESPQLLFDEADATGAGPCRLFVTRGGVFGTSVLPAASFRGPWDLGLGLKIDEGAAPELNRFAPSLLEAAGMAPVPESALLFSRHENYYEWDRYNYAIQFDLLIIPETGVPQILDRQGLAGWDASGAAVPSAFAYAPTFEDNPMARGAAVSSGYLGHSWLSSFEAYRSVTGGVASQVGDSLGAAAMGRLRSPEFTVTGERLDFRIGGAGHPDSCWLSLRLAPDGDSRFRTTPPGGPGSGVPGGEGLPLQARAWDTRSIQGQRAYLEIVDGARGPGGFIALDHFVWSQADPAAADPPLHLGPDMGFTLVTPPRNPWLPAAGALALTLRVEAPGDYRVRLYDPRGRRVASVGGGALPAGLWTAAFDGARLATGLYLIRVEGPRGALARKLVLLR